MIHKAAVSTSHQHLNMSNHSSAIVGNNSSSSGSQNGDNSHPEIDEALYSRQLYVLGHEAMRRMQASNVFISGMGGLGLEIAKNLVLGGVKSVSIYDPQNATHDDLATHFFLTESQIGQNRALVSHPHLAELNPYVPVKVVDSIEVEQLQQYQVVVLTDNSTEEQIKIGKFCHAKGIKFIVAETRGIFGQIFCDFGDSFEVVDPDGEQPLSAMLSAINNDENGTVTTLDEQRHGFEDDMIVTFSEVKGMSEVNAKEFKIKGKRLNDIINYTISNSLLF